jgi:anthranilate synthase/aminodeoxychorismate synthase-like glutamine amidotransferase
MIDNYDSFTYNLVQLFGRLGVPHMQVVRNDAITLEGLIALRPQVLIVSPGPCSPTEAGISVPAITHFLGKVPLLGVCLGHQSLVHALGGDIIRAQRLMHGKTSPVFHDDKGLHRGVPNPFEATRYHSLLARPETLPEALLVSARTWENEIMGVRHHQHPAFGVQYHPESILTAHGWRVMDNFIRVALDFYQLKHPHDQEQTHVSA